MLMKRYQPEQVVNLLRKNKVETASVKSVAQAAREAGICEQPYYRWRKEFSGLKLAEARRLKELEIENSRVKCPSFGTTGSG
jgi:putative transposase